MFIGDSFVISKNSSIQPVVSPLAMPPPCIRQNADTNAMRSLGRCVKRIDVASGSEESAREAPIKVAAGRDARVRTYNSRGYKRAGQMSLLYSNRHLDI